MLKGQVFKEQIFENQIFAVFINTFLAGKNGIINGYKNSMQVTAGTNTVTIQSGVICIQGRFLEEDTEYTLATGTDTAFCKLIVEIDLDKVNTETDFAQGYYKIVKSETDYPELTQDDIVNMNSGVYQYELARFKTSLNGISEFSDRREYIDYDSLYNLIEQKLNEVEDGSIYVLQSQFEEFEKKVKNLYPIGAIYLSMTSTNPSEYFGGTWARIAQGKMLVGVNEDDTDFKTANLNGGSKTRKITKEELPSYNLTVTDTHQHYLYGNANDSGDGTGIHVSRRLVSPQTAGAQKGTGTGNYIANDARDNRTYGTGAYLYTEAANMGSIKVASGGSDQPYNNMSPYLTCYIWQRTA